MAASDDRLARVERRLDVLTYMVGTNITLTLLTLGLLWQVVRSLPR